MSVDLEHNTSSALAVAAQDGGRADSLTDPLSSASALGDSLEDGGDAVQMCGDGSAESRAQEPSH